MVKCPDNAGFSATLAPNRGRSPLLPWAFGAIFTFCAVQLQSQFGTSEAWVYLVFAALTAALWLGRQLAQGLGQRLAEHIVEIAAIGLLSCALGLMLLGNQAAGARLLSKLAIWSPLTAAWWGLGGSPMRNRLLYPIVIGFFLALLVSLPDGSAGSAVSTVAPSLFVLGLTRRWTSSPGLAANEETGDFDHAGQFRDASTGVYGRDYFEAELAHISAVANRYQWAFSLVALEIEGFSARVARCGNAACGEIERKIAWQIADQVRASDTVCHWSDGRFLVLLPNTDQSEALAMAEILRKSILSSAIGGDDPAAIVYGVSQHLAGEDPMATLSAAEDELEIALRQPSPVVQRNVGKQ